MKKIITTCVFIAITLSISACGFRLRGADYMPAQLHTLRISSVDPYGSFQASLRAVLVGSGVHIVSSAPYTLHISQDHFDYSTASVGGSTEPRAYTLSYTVTYALYGKKGRHVVGPLSVASSRSYTVPAGEVLEASNELNVIRREMERDVVRQLLNTLASDNTRRALQ